MSAAVEVHGLRKTYGSRRVLDDLDLMITAGECFALLGPNGAGKTTAVEILEGFRVRDAGTVLVLGRDPATGDRMWRSRVGVVAQDVGAPLDLSVREALRHFAAYHAEPRSADELLAAVGLDASADVRIPNLSGGQRGSARPIGAPRPCAGARTEARASCAPRRRPRPCAGCSQRTRR